MAYQALYRKWRPRTFDQVIGQDAIMTALKNQVKSGRIGHAYLFCGTRGTGKTSTAKIFARAVNCLHPVDGNPCNECELCREGENDFNVVEIDAASNNGVDNIRDLRDGVRYAPAQGKYRVYIIDEVHMLSTSAFNALLKTLEEPPAHVIFVLATTEPHKILPTILSRCQRYDFKRISAPDLAGQLTGICQKENIPAEPDALRYIADAADGASRDAISLLDQCAAYYMGETLTLDKVLGVLGASDRHIFFEMTRILSRRDKSSLLEQLEELFTSGRDTSRFLLDWIGWLRSVLLYQMLGQEASRYLPASEAETQDLTAVARALGPETVSYYIEKLSELELTLRSAADKRVLLEVGLLRLCRLESNSLRALAARLEQLEKSGVTLTAAPSGEAPVQASAAYPSVSDPQSSPAPSPVPEEPAAKKADENRPSSSGARTDAPAAPAAPLTHQLWNRIVRDAAGDSMGFAALLGKCKPVQTDEGIVILTENSFTKDQLLRSAGAKQAVLVEELRKALGSEILVQFLTKEEFAALQPAEKPSADDGGVMEKLAGILPPGVFVQ